MKKFYEIGGYSQWIDIETGKYSCTCKFGSFYGQSKKNKGKLCRHLKQAYDELKYETDTTQKGTA